MRTATRSLESLEDAAFAAGAAFAALDAVVRRDEHWAGAWRQRLALAAAAVTARQSGRVEDEAALRDAVLLTRPGDDVGPAGRILVVWRRLASQPAQALLSRDALSATIGAFGVADAETMATDLAKRIKRSTTIGGSPVAAAVAAFESVREHRGNAAQGLAPWLADAVLAKALGWPHAIPLLCAELAGGGGNTRFRAPVGAGGPLAGREALRLRLLAAYARAALRAISLSADLGRRADVLLAIAPKLRAKGAAAVVEKLLAEDAVSGSQAIAGISDRGLRRLFDRLTDLGGVRELSGRPTFRLYGL